MNARTTIRRSLAVGALAAAAALALPCAAQAAVPADVRIDVDGNTIRATITVPQTPEGRTVCFGPWVHTEVSAQRILNSPDLDLDAQPVGWATFMPDSPSTGIAIGDQPYKSTVIVSDGQSGEAAMPAIAPGKYVAGVLCGLWAERPGTIPPVTYTSLELYPLTVGDPALEPGGSGSLGSLSFGS
ncbi:hypothetical protein GS534_00765 [Rhodococcus hoagii]|nr:hypothetical protein [Prescottella equi]